MLARAGARALRTALIRPAVQPLPIHIRSFAQKKQRPSSAQLGRKQRQSSEHDEPQPQIDLNQTAAPKATEETGEQQSPDPAQIPLHDLTKGLPSTIDAELADSARRAQEEKDEAGEGKEIRPFGGPRGERRMPAGAYETSAEKRKNAIFGYTIMAMGAGAVFIGAFLGRNWANDEEEKQHPSAPSGWGPTLFYNRLKARLTSTMDYYNEPAFPKLLPDPDPAWARPYTLVLSLENMLVHSEWTREHGWRIAKRPGVDYFLRYLSQYYEIVIFTSLPMFSADPVIRKLDPFHVAMWPLFREATRYTKGKYVKDLSFLNRDLSKVILIDTDPTHASMQPENAIILPKWTGTPDDKDLVSLIPFLEYLAALGLSDTRKVLDSYKNVDSIAAEFARREAQARERFKKQLAEDKARRPQRGSGMGFVGKALGIKNGQGMIPIPEMEGVPTLTEGFDQGMMLHDQIRLRGQRQYAMIEKEIRENGEKWLKELAEDEERAKEEAMKGMKSSVTGWFSGKREDSK